MKILWVEDFGAELEPLETSVGVFSGLIPLEIDALRREFDPDEDSIGQLVNLLEKHTLHELHVCNSYIEWKAYERQAGDFDVVLVDIDLTSYPTPKDKMPEGIDTAKFDGKAGFYIYNRLIKSGFPDDDIAFFTGQEQSLGDFSKYCGKVFLDKPKNCFEKNPLQFARLRQWLNDKATQPSLILRRGIIEGCRYAKTELRAIDNRDLDACLLFYKTTSIDVTKDPEGIRDDLIDYLANLENSFLRNRDHTPYELYKFVKELVAKWEPSIGYFKRSKTPAFKTRLEDLFFSTGQFLMKAARNWSSHRLLSENLSEKDAAYFFMLAMRSWMKFDLGHLLEHERLLSLLFPPLPKSDLNRQVNGVLENQLERSFYTLRSLYSEALANNGAAFPEDSGADNLFFSMLKGLGDALRKTEEINPTLRRRVREVSLSFFYQGYWHGLFPLWIKPSLYGNLQSLGFNIEPIPADSFLHLLGSAIFEESFKEEQDPVTVIESAASVS